MEERVHLERKLAGDLGRRRPKAGSVDLRVPPYQDTMKREEQLEAKRREFLEQQQSGTTEGGGGVKLGILADLNDMSVDLSKQLSRKRAQAPTAPQAAASPAIAQPKRLPPRPLPPGQEPLSRLNAEKLKRQNRGAARAPVVTLQSREQKDEAERLRVIEEERKKYELKKTDFAVGDVLVLSGPPLRRIRCQQTIKIKAFTAGLLKSRFPPRITYRCGLLL